MNIRWIVAFAALVGAAPALQAAQKVGPWRDGSWTHEVRVLGEGIGRQAAYEHGLKEAFAECDKDRGILENLSFEYMDKEWGDDRDIEHVIAKGYCRVKP